jgi:hypothetical protein
MTHSWTCNKSHDRGYNRGARLQLGQERYLTRVGYNPRDSPVKQTRS